MVEHPGDYSWSSYRYNAMGEEDALMTHHSLYGRLGRSAQARQSVYRQLFRAQLGKADVEAIREATNKAWVLGDDRFKEKVEKIAGRRTRPKPRGRPFKDDD
jgi:putative transposase